MAASMIFTFILLTSEIRILSLLKRSSHTQQRQEDCGVKWQSSRIYVKSKKDLSIDCSISALTAFTAYNVLSSWHDAKYTLGYFITKLRNGIIVTGSHFMYIAYLYMLSYSVFFCRGSFFCAFKGIIWSALAFYLVNKFVVKK